MIEGERGLSIESLSFQSNIVFEFSLVRLLAISVMVMINPQRGVQLIHHPRNHHD